MLEVVNSWVEQSFASGHLFVVPRVHQCDFVRVHKDIHFICVTWAAPVGLVSAVPFVIFYLNPLWLMLPLGQKGWTRLPLPEIHLRSRNNWRRCMGCSTTCESPAHVCLFEDTGFTLGSRVYKPCHVRCQCREKGEYIVLMCRLVE